MSNTDEEGSRFDKKDAQKWHNGLGEEFLRSIELKEDQVVLDFGCGIGNYSIAAAKVVGPTGKVYALDKLHEDDYDPLSDDLVPQAERLGLKNIVPIKTKGELTIPLPYASIDVVLLYDVIHGLLKDDIESFRALIKEICRVIKSGGIFSLFDPHLKEETIYTHDDIIGEISSFFSYEGTFEKLIIHWDYLQQREIQIFRK